MVSHVLDLDRSPGTSVGGNPALVYDSTTANAKPVIEATLQTDNAAALPATAAAVLTWDGTAGATVTYSTAGFAPGDLVSLAVQAPSGQTTGRHVWSLTVNFPGSGVAPQTSSGVAYVVARDSSAFGAGWAFSGSDRLITVTADGYGDPAGVVRVEGTGGTDFYAGPVTPGVLTTYTSTNGDTGRLVQLAAGGWTYTSPDGRVATFDASGRLVGRASADGKALTTLTYNATDVATFQSSDGATTTFTYSGSLVSAISTSTGSATRTATLTYSGTDLTVATDPDGRATTYAYSSHEMTQEAYGPVVRGWSYGSDGLVSTSFSGTGTDLVTFAVTPQSRVGLAALGLGTPAGTAVSPLGHATSETVDARGRVLSQTAADGTTTTLVRDPSTGWVASSTDGLGRTTTYAYDAYGSVASETLPDGGRLTMTYQAGAYGDGGLFHRTLTSADEAGKVTSYAYDALGHLTRTTDPTGQNTSYVYDGATGLLVNIENANGTVLETFGYDSARRELTDQKVLSGTTTTAYDAQGNVASVAAPLLGTTTYVNDALGRNLTVTDPQGGVTTSAYDAAAELIETFDPRGVETLKQYDTRGDLTRKVAGANTATPVVTAVAFDADGRQVQARDGSGAATLTTFDGRGRATGSSDGLGLTAGQTVYDDAGRVVAQADALGNVTSYAYDALGRLVATTDALGGVTTAVYDAAGNVVATVDPLGHATTMVYDAADRVVETEDALGNVTSTVYDARSAGCCPSRTRSAG